MQQGLHVAAYTLVQFQPGMSLPEFLQSFGTEAAFANPFDAGNA